MSQQNTEFAELFAILPVPALILTEAGEFVDANPAFCAALEAGPGPLDLADPSRWMRPEDLPAFLDCAAGRGCRREALVNLDGARPKWFEARSAPVVSGGKNIRLVLLDDITEKKSLRQHLDDCAHICQTTGAFSKASFMSLANIEFSRSRRHGYPLACMALSFDARPALSELDQAAREKAMAGFCESIKSQLRQTDLVGRALEDSFWAALPQTPFGGAADVADRIRARFCQAPGAGAPGAKVAIGISMLDPADASFESLLARCAGAMANAQSQGGNCICSVLL